MGSLHATVDTRDPRVQVIDIDGREVDRGVVTFTDAAGRGEAIADGLRSGDRIYFNGALIHCADPLKVPQVYAR